MGLSPCSLTPVSEILSPLTIQGGDNLNAIQNAASKVLSLALDLLYPPKCMYCGKILDSKAQMVCPRCSDSLEILCNVKYLPQTVCLSPFHYSGSVKHAIQRYKFENLPMFSAGFAEPMAKTILGCPQYSFDIVSWVPLGKKRFKSRGYDQARLLAEKVAGLIHVCCAPTLNKNADNSSQTSTNSEHARRENVRGVYDIRDDKIISGKSILLIDDVCTTGSTLSECVKVLLDSGALQVICLTIAQTEKNAE